MALYKALGCDVQPLRLPGRRHLYVSITTKDNRRSLAECHISLNLVDKDVVGNFLSLMKKEKYSEGAIISLGEVAEKARHIAKKKRVFLYDGNEFLSFWKSLNLSSSISQAPQSTSTETVEIRPQPTTGIQGGEPQELEPASSLPAQTEPNIWIPAESEEPAAPPAGAVDLALPKPARSRADIHHLLGGETSAHPVTQASQPPVEPEPEGDLPDWLTAPTPAEFMAVETPSLEESILPAGQPEAEPVESEPVEAVSTEADLLVEPGQELQPEAIPSVADLPSEPVEDISPEEIPVETDLLTETVEDIPSEEIPFDSDLPSEPIEEIPPEEILFEADLPVEDVHPEVIPLEAELPEGPVEATPPEIIPVDADLPVELVEEIQLEVIPLEAGLPVEPVEVVQPDVIPLEFDLPVEPVVEVPPEGIPLNADLPVETVADIQPEVFPTEGGLTEEPAEAVPQEVIPPEVDLLAGLEELQKAATEEEESPVLIIPVQTPPDEPAAEAAPVEDEAAPIEKTAPFSTPINLEPPVERVQDENANVIQRLFGEEPAAESPEDAVEAPVEEIPSQPHLEIEQPAAKDDGKDDIFTSEEQSIWTANVEKKIRIDTEPANANPIPEAAPSQTAEPSDLPVKQTATPLEQAAEVEPQAVNPLEPTEDIQPEAIPPVSDLPVEPVEDIQPDVITLDADLPAEPVEDLQPEVLPLDPDLPAEPVEDLQPEVILLDADLLIEPVEVTQPEVSPFEADLLAEHGQDVQPDKIPTEDDLMEEPVADISPDETHTEAAAPPDQTAEIEPQVSELVEEVPVAESIPPVEVTPQTEAPANTPAVVPDSSAPEPVKKIETAPLPALPVPQIVVLDPAQYNGNILHAPDLGDPSLCMAFEKMQSSSPCIFITGKAGTRKNTLLDYFIKSSDTNTVVLSPTEIGAIYIQGSPIRAFFGFPEGPIEEKDVQEIADPAKREMYRHIDTLVIYEVSNVSAGLIDAMDTFMRRNGRYAERPFGGTRLILFGDLFRPAQASPEADLAAPPIEGYRSNYFFDAHVFENLPIHLIELQHDYYHRSEELILLLNSLKTNSLSEAQQQFLKSKHIPGFAAPTDEVFVTLTTTDAEAAHINNEQLKKLPMPECVQFAEVEDKFYERGFPVEQELVFRRGAQVMFLSNDRTKRWVRGTIGKVTSVSESSLQVRIDYEGSPFILRVERENWQAYGYTFNPASGKIEKEVIGEYTQYPLRLAWAVSVDKSQGSCFNNVIVDPGESTLDYQLAYAALCSCKSLNGIVLRSPFVKSDATPENNRILHIARLFST